MFSVLRGTGWLAALEVVNELGRSLLHLRFIGPYAVHFVDYIMGYGSLETNELNHQHIQPTINGSHMVLWWRRAAHTAALPQPVGHSVLLYWSTVKQPVVFTSLDRLWEAQQIRRACYWMKYFVTCLFLFLSCYILSVWVGNSGCPTTPTINPQRPWNSTINCVEHYNFKIELWWNHSVHQDYLRKTQIKYKVCRCFSPTACGLTLKSNNET